MKYKIGDKNNLLTILEISGRGDTRNFKCKCDCGEIKNIKPKHFYRKKSCGCYYSQTGSNNYNWNGYGEISGKVWSSYKNGAQERNISFNIKIEDAWNKFLEQNRKCAISGLTIGFTNAVNQASLDRIDSKKGYRIDNIQWVDKNINTMKWDFPQIQFIDYCHAISDYQNNRKIESSIHLDFEDVLIKPKRSSIRSRADVNLTSTYITKYSRRKITGFPVISSNMDTTGSLNMASALTKEEAFCCLHKFIPAQDIIDYFNNNDTSRIFYTLGSRPLDLEKFNSIYNKVKIQNICIDVANGYIDDFVEICNKIRNTAPEAIIMAGNVATGDGVRLLVNKGRVDIVKIGTGSGGLCETRIVAGVGVPQLSCLIETSKVAQKLGVLTCSDGGVKELADFSKAFGAGASFVMCGSLFAGYDECDGDWIYDDDGNKSLVFHGMSSDDAMIKHYGKVNEYRTAEGKTVTVRSKGSIIPLIKKIKGAVRSTCTYINSKNIADMNNNTEFIKVNRRVNTVFEK